MEVKEEITDVDSENVQHSDPDDLFIMTMISDSQAQAVKLKQQSLQDSLELCIMELKKLCIREAELTGRLPSDYPVLPGEKLPRIRQRIGATFKLDEPSIRQGQDPEISSLETKLALQEQIYMAMHKLCQEDQLSKTLKKSRAQQLKREEKKLKELQEALIFVRLKQDRRSINDRQSKVSAWSDKEELTSHSQPSHRPLTPTSPMLHPRKPVPSPQQPRREHLHPTLEYNLTHGQNSRNPHLKPNSHSNSANSSPAATPTLPRLEFGLGDHDFNPPVPTDTGSRHNQSSSTPSTPEMQSRRGQHLSASATPTLPRLEVPSHAGLRHNQSSSTPSTPEMQSRRGHFLRSPTIEPRDRSWMPRHQADVFPTTPEYSPPPRMSPMGNPPRHESSFHPSFFPPPCHELLFKPEYTRNHYGSPSLSQSYVPLGYYRCPSIQPSPKPYRGHLGEERLYDWNADRMHFRFRPTSPSITGQYSYWYNETPVYPPGYGPTYHHFKPPQAPSLREYALHQNRVSQARWGQSSPSRGFSTASCAHTPWARIR